MEAAIKNQDSRIKNQKGRVKNQEPEIKNRETRIKNRNMAHNFINLAIWQKSMDLTDLVHEYCKGLPGSERFNLIDQMNRSSCSVPANIAEGCGKRSAKQFAEYLSTSLSSAFELQTQLLICQRRQYGKKENLEKCLELTVEVQKKIFSFRERVE
jgi:four helix bundle protein